MKCPKCESDNTQRLEVAFQGGTQNISTSSNTTGIGISGGGRIGLGLAKTKTSGQSQSILAQQASPPAKKSFKWPGIGAFVGVMILNTANYQVVQSLVGLAIVGLSGYLIYTRIQFNSKEWPGLYRHWSESWICHKCGDIYHQPV